MTLKYTNHEIANGQPGDLNVKYGVCSSHDRHYPKRNMCIKFTYQLMAHLPNALQIPFRECRKSRLGALTELRTSLRRKGKFETKLCTKPSGERGISSPNPKFPILLLLAAIGRALVQQYTVIGCTELTVVYCLHNK